MQHELCEISLRVAYADSSITNFCIIRPVAVASRQMPRIQIPVLVEYRPVKGIGKVKKAAQRE